MTEFERVHFPHTGSSFERTLRISTGLILFAYATTHLINHAFGVRSVEAMQSAGSVLLKPWQTYPGLAVLYGALLIHASLGLGALYRRRHLRIPASEALQLALGLAIPLLLIPHAADIHIASYFFGIEYDYSKLLHRFWLDEPTTTLVQQYLLILAVWIHGCIGLRAYLRPRTWYPIATVPLASLATLIPVLAAIGIASAGLRMRDMVQADPVYASKFVVPLPGTPRFQQLSSVAEITGRLSLSYLVLVAAVFGLRTARDWHVRRFRAVRVNYSGGRTVTVPVGFSVLEASRWAGIPHTSVCGGRGRCSTCRVRVHDGAKSLGPMGSAERTTLARIGAPPSVRLACQIRPSADVAVELLVPAVPPKDTAARRFAAAIEGGRELEIAAMFVDLRESTQLAADRLPYDALFLFDRYIQATTIAVREHRGHVTSIAGDGVMSVFGIEGDAKTAAREGLQAALQIWKSIDDLNSELAVELRTPLRVGIGLHVGVAVVGMVDHGEGGSLQFLGDTGNTAAKLEAQTKTLGGTLVVSTYALNLVTPVSESIERVVVAIPGKAEPIEAAIFKNRNELSPFTTTARH